MSVQRLRAWRRRTMLAGAIGIALCGASAAWSVRAAHEIEVSLPEVATRTTEPEPPSIEPVPMESFARRLTFPAPPAQPEPGANPDEARSADTRLVLLGIVESPEGGLVAAIHDRSDDRVHFVREGDTLGRSRVRAVAPRSVDLAEGDTARRLELKSPKPPGSGPGSTPGLAPGSAGGAS